MLSVRFCSTWEILERQESIAKQPARIELSGFSSFDNKVYYYSVKYLNTPSSLAFGSKTA
jgi:hypothetical protein